MQVYHRSDGTVAGNIAGRGGRRLFELGGHSLLVTQLTSRLERDFNVHIDLLTLMENPIRAISTRISRRNWGRRQPRNSLSVKELNDERGGMGAGVMGTGVAHNMAQYGISTNVVDISQSQLDKCRQMIEANLRLYNFHPQHKKKDA